MGAVYEAAHLRLDRRFAIKVLLESSASSKEMLARFQREARITSGIGHPNIVEVTDFQHLPEGRPYIVMELLEGEDLGGRMKRHPAIELSEAASILEQAAAGLQAAPAGNDDGFVAKLTPDLKQLVYGTLIGGSGQDHARAVAVDAAGHIVAVGTTASANFPATTGAYQTTATGTMDAFLARW